jgi:hypothetical protein
MRVLASWIIAFLAIASTAIAGDGRKSFRFKADGFAIDFPSAPITTNEAINAATMVRTKEYYVGINSYVFIVAATSFRSEAREQIGGDKRLLRLLIDAFAADCASRAERPILVRGAAAREIHAENCEKGPATIARYYFVDDWLYQVVVVGPTSMGTSIEAQHFMKSFRITGK